MNQQKETVIENCHHTLEWIENLHNISEEKWRKPIAKGKWTVAEVVGHFIYWDQYFINRIPEIIDESTLTQVDIESVNQEASRESKTKSKEEIFERFHQVREELIQLLQSLDDDLWDQEFHTNNGQYTLYGDLKRLINHDQHHIKQLEHVIY
ncbi:hypothetical protein J416_08017 [Gracilibacillus halophilus YIM-C55.5]|uniref:DinB-like domain-containing protein n=1 Tax=Gracilibacillus halophilus YIM-C55.5 TaxID=1308866 RepID=N4WLG9_9BACI|nr:DinB family protein [Gracilibacillus halophilus]ENH97007.1 hypothetical protein J416_08017 [Gracilibacillus halophilus YIM-C55.5]